MCHCIFIWLSWKKNAFFMLVCLWYNQLHAVTWPLHVTLVTDYRSAVPGDLPPGPLACGHFASSENCSCISSPVPDNIVLTRLWHDYSAASAADGKALFQTPLHGIKWIERLWEDKIDRRQREMRNTTAFYGFHKVWSDMVSQSYKHRVWLETCRLNLPTPPLVVMFGLSVLQRTA